MVERVLGAAARPGDGDSEQRYRLERAFDRFLVPLEPGADGARYEPVFA